MMLPLWRLEHDWIHRSKTGQLDFLKKSVIYCKKIHIRSKSISELSLHAVKTFFETSIEPKKLEQMRQVKPDVKLLKSSLEGIKTNVLGILNKHNEIMFKSSEIIFQQKQLDNTVRNMFVKCSITTFNFVPSDSDNNFFLPVQYVSHKYASYFC